MQFDLYLSFMIKGIVAKRAAKSWYSEIKAYNFEKPGDKYCDNGTCLFVKEHQWMLLFATLNPFSNQFCSDWLTGGSKTVFSKNRQIGI